MRHYLDIPVDAGAGATVSFFCAQAPRLNAPAAMAKIMIILTSFTINSPPLVAGCCGLVRRGNQCLQRNSPPFFLGLNYYLRAQGDLIEKSDQVVVPHPNATVTGRLANLIFMICAVDINVTLAGIRVVFFKAIEPENPRHNQIFGRGQGVVWGERNASLKYGPDWKIRADLFANLEPAKRGLPAALL